MILIVTAPSDTHADRMERLLRSRNQKYIRFNPADLTQTAVASATFGMQQDDSRRVSGNQSPFDLESVTAVWWRRPEFPQPAVTLTDAAAAAVSQAELAGFARDFLDTLGSGDCRILPGPYLVTDRAQGKLRQLQLASELGFELPPTLVTHDPEALLEFAARYERLITKLASPGLPLLDADGTTVHRYTELLRPIDLLNVDALALAPVIVQAYVAKRSELRVTVVGQRVLAAEIHSQDTHHTKDDWRRYDNGHTVITEHRLPAAVERLCVALTEALGVCYGAIDLILTPEGRYVFLEINPSGQYAWIEQMAGLPISDAIADYLTGVEMPTKVAS